MKQQSIDSCCCRCYEPATIKQTTIFGEEPYCESCYTLLGVTDSSTLPEDIENAVEKQVPHQLEWVEK